MRNCMCNLFDTTRRKIQMTKLKISSINVTMNSEQFSHSLKPTRRAFSILWVVTGCLLRISVCYSYSVYSIRLPAFEELVSNTVPSYYLFNIQYSHFGKRNDPKCLQNAKFLCSQIHELDLRSKFENEDPSYLST